MVWLWLSACTAVPTTGMTTTTSIDYLQIPLEQPADTVKTDARLVWGSKPDCSVTKTGLGLTRKAYALETCRYENITDRTLCGQTPSGAIYRFLEGKLVQVAIDFTGAPIRTALAADLINCVQQESFVVGYTATTLGSESTDEGVMRLTSPDQARQLSVFGDGSLVVSVMPLASQILGLRGTF